MFLLPLLASAVFINSDDKLLFYLYLEALIDLSIIWIPFNKLLKWPSGQQRWISTKR